MFLLCDLLVKVPNSDLNHGHPVVIIVLGRLRSASLRASSTELGATGHLTAPSHLKQHQLFEQDDQHLDLLGKPYLGPVLLKPNGAAKTSESTLPIGLLPDLELQLAFGDKLQQSGDPWRFSPFQLRRIWNVGTKVNVDLFASLVQGYDAVEADWVVRGLRDGFPIGIPAEGPFPPERIWADSLVPDDAKVIIEDFFDSEKEARRIFGPFVAPHGEHWQGACSYPVSVIPKSSGGWRIISNLSFGGSRFSANGFVSASARRTEYPSFLEVATKMVQLGLDRVWTCLFDVENAYRQLSLSPADWRFSIISWRNALRHRLHLLDTSLTFGGAANCTTFNRVGMAVEYILEVVCCEGASFDEILAALLRYLDDFLILATSEDEANRLLDIMLEVMRSLNFPVKAAKTLRAAVTRKFLGYLWLPRCDTVTIDAARWIAVELQLRDLAMDLIEGRATAADVNAAAGLLGWISRVIPNSSIFIRGLYLVVRLLEATSLPAASARRIRIVDPSHISEALHDVSWWIGLCEDYRRLGAVPRGIRISEVVSPSWLDPDDCPLLIFVDASEFGVAGYWADSQSTAGGRWCRAPLPRGVTLSWERGGGGFIHDGRRSLSSGLCEAAALLGTLQTFLPIFAAENPLRAPQHGVFVFSDSAVVVDVWNKRRPSATLLPYLRAFAHIGALFNVRLIIRHIDGVANSTADSLSRNQMDRFRALRPTAALHSSAMPSEEAYFLLAPVKDYSRGL